MEIKRNRITMPCDCGCCMLMFEKTVWEDRDICYDISVQDARYDHNSGTLWGKVKGAAKMLMGKPVRYNNVHLEGTAQFDKLLCELVSLKEKD